MAAKAVFSLFIELLLCFGNFMEMGTQKNSLLSELTNNGQDTACQHF